VNVVLVLVLVMHVIGAFLKKWIQMDIFKNMWIRLLKEYYNKKRLSI
jgi:hypothetical protein